jgi:YD repeat-containing protein
VVAYVSGIGFGLERSSGFVIGSQGQLGQSKLGINGDDIYVNTITGNLVVQRNDEMLIGVGPNDQIDRTYNSLTTYSQTGWQEGFQRNVTVITAGSTLRRIAADGSDVTYTWNGSAYVGNEESGAFDTIVQSGTNWVWTDGKTRDVEVYDSNHGGRLTSVTDKNHNVLTYNWDPVTGNLTSIVTSDGESTTFTWSGTNVASITTAYTDLATNTSKTLTRVYYTYDTNVPARLSTVTVDLTPGDNSIADANTYTTTYTYSGTTDRITKISGSDGTYVSFLYDGSRRVISITTSGNTSGVGVSRTTTLSYDTGSRNTTVTDPLGNHTVFSYDTSQRLTSITDAAGQITHFNWDANNDFTYLQTPDGVAGNKFASYVYDPATGNLTSATGPNGELTTYTYNADNQVTSKTVNLYNDPTLGEVTGTTYYAYDSNDNLVYVVSPEGRVTQYKYNASGQQTSAIEYLSATYTGAVTNANMDSWVQGLATAGALALTNRTDTTYDFRGNISTVTTYANVVANTGAGDTGVPSQVSTTTWVYDQSGRLLSKQPNNSASAEQFAYDGLGRMTTSTDFAGGVTHITFPSNGSKVQVQLVNGTTETSVYDHAGELISYAVAASGLGTATTTYKYDADGRLRAETDPTGLITYFLYDADGRKVADILPDGTLTEYVYNAASGQLVKTIAYATKLTAGQIASLSDADGAPTNVNLNTVINPNLLLQSEHFEDSSQWTLLPGGVTVTTNTAADPNGATTVDTINLPAVGAGVQQISSTPAVPGQHYTFSIWLAGTAGQTVTINLGTSTGVGGSASTAVTLTAALKRVTVTLTPAAGATGNLQVQILVASGQTATSVKAWGAQLNVGAAATYYMATGSTAPATAPVRPSTNAADRTSYNLYDISGNLIETVDPSGAATVFSYDQDDRLVSSTAYATRLAPGAVQGTEETAVAPTADPVHDRTTRYFYDKDGNLVGTLDPLGYLTQTLWDGAGQKTQTIRFSNVATNTTGNFAQVLGSVTANTAKDIHNWWVYDSRGFLRYVIDGEGDVTAYARTQDGYIQSMTSGQQLAVAGLISTPPTFAGVTTALAGLAPTTLDVTSYTVNQYGQVLQETKTLASGGSEVSNFSYDNMHRLVSQTIAANQTDARTQDWTYDGFGRLTGSLTGDGAVALAALGSSPTQGQINAVWAQYGTTYAYDAAGRIKSKTSPNGTASGETTLYYYDADGRALYAVDELGEVTGYAYNSFGQTIDTVRYGTALTAPQMSGWAGGVLSLATEGAAVTSAIATLTSNNSDFHTDYNVTGTVADAKDALNKQTTYTYDAFGDVQTIVDPLAIQTTNTWDQRGLLHQVAQDSGTGGLNVATIYNYDAFGRVTQKTDPKGGNWLTGYDRAGRIVSTTDAVNNLTQYTFDGRGNVFQIIDANNVTTTYTVDQFERHTTSSVTVSDPGSATHALTVTTTRDDFGDTVQVSDSAGRAVAYQYDQDGNLTQSTTGFGFTSYAYDSADNLTQSMVHRNGPNPTVNYTYDAENRLLTKIVDPKTITTPNDNPNGLNLTTTYAWDAKGEEITVTDPAGRVDKISYDLNGRKLSYTVDYGGQALTTTWQYDADGRQITMTKASGTSAQEITGYTYDNLDRLKTTTLDQGGLAYATNYYYDANGNAIASTDPNGATSYYVYDADNRVIYSVDPLGDITHTTYDADGRVQQTSVLANQLPAADMPSSPSTPLTANTVTTYAPTTSADTTVAYAYDAKGRLIQSTQDPSGLNLITKFAYDDSGNLIAKTDPTNQVTRYFYDGSNNLIYTVDAVGDVTQNFYDVTGEVQATRVYATPIAAGTLATFSNTTTATQVGAAISNSANDGVTWYVYDMAGRQTYAVDGAGDVTQTAYDADGRVVYLQRYATPIAASVLSTFSPSITSAQVSANVAPSGSDQVTRYVYDSAGRKIYEVDGLGDVTQTSYDAQGRVLSIRGYNNQISSSALSGFGQAITALQVTSNASTSASDHLVNYVYDTAGRMRYALDAFLRPTEYDYDSAGNLIKKIVYAGQVASSSSYSLTYVTAQIGTFSAAVNANNRITRYVYDAAGREAWCVDAMNGVTGYTYDSNGRVVRKSQFYAQYTGGDPAMSDMTNFSNQNISDNRNRVTLSFFDDAGRALFSVTGYGADGKGFITGYQYDGAGRVTSKTRYTGTQADQSQLVASNATTSSMQSTVGPLTGATTTYTYDSAGRLTDVVDPNSIRTHSALDGVGRATDTTVAYGTSDAATTHSVYDAAGRVTSQVTGYGSGQDQTTSYLYDGLGRTTGKMGRFGSAQMAGNVGNLGSALAYFQTYGCIYAYDGNGDLLTETTALDALGNKAITSNQYDAFGDKVKVTDPDGAVGLFYYDLLGRLTVQVDPMGYATVTSYTLGGQVAGVTRYAAQVANYQTLTPAAAPNLPAPSYAAGDEITSFGRDKLDRLTSSTDAETYTESYGLDAFGDRLTDTNKLSATTSYSYDRRGLMLTETLPVGSYQSNGSLEVANVINTYKYDARGNRIQMVEASNCAVHRTTNYQYDAGDRLISQYGDSVTAYTYDGNGNLNGSSVTPTQTTVYDGRGNVIKTTDAGGGAIYTYYDHNNHKVAQVDAGGTLTTWSWNSASNAITVTICGDAVTSPPLGGAAPTPTANIRQTIQNFDFHDRLTSTVAKGVENGALNGGIYSFGVNDITTNTTTYDADGNVLTSKDGRGGMTYYWYDKLGRKIAQLDQAKYLTTYALDQDGNVKTETRYATAYGGSVSTSTVPSVSSSPTTDRVTIFTYDRNGRRLTEARQAVAYATVSGDSLSAQTGAATIIYTYNGLGEVTSKTQATGEVINYGYDGQGRQTSITNPSYADYSSGTDQRQTLEYYNGLNELTLSAVGQAGAPLSSDRQTTYAYAVGGRLISQTDPTSFTQTFLYDAAGRVLSQQYQRLLSDGLTYETDGQFFKYDVAGRATSQKTGHISGSTWVYGDSTDEYYDGFGEMIARGINTAGNLANAAEFANYDHAGRVWRTNLNDGVTKAYAYDANGNATLLIQSLGTTNLKSSSYNTVGDILGDHSAGDAQTISVYDARNQLTDTIQPASNNAGANPVSAYEVTTNGSGVQYFAANIAVQSSSEFSLISAGGGSPPNTSNNAAAGKATSVYMQEYSDRYQDNYDGTSTVYWVVSLNFSSGAFAQINGGGTLHVMVDDGDGRGQVEVGAMAPGGGLFTSPELSMSTVEAYYYTPPAPVVGISVYQDLSPSGPRVLVASGVVEAPVTGPGGDTGYTANPTTPATLQIQNVSTNATALRMFVRPNVANAMYTEYDATPMSNGTGGTIAGWFTFDLTRPPFNGAANGSWNVIWLAMDSAGNIYDSKQGQVTTDGSGNPTVSGVSAMNVGGPGQAMLVQNAGSNYVLFSGVSTSVTSVKLHYRASGGGAWTTVNMGSMYGQNGLWGYNMGNSTSTYEYWFEPLNSSGGVVGGRSYGQMAAPNNWITTLYQYSEQSHQITLTPPSGQPTTSQQVIVNGNTTGGPATGAWNFDFSSMDNLWTDQSYSITYNCYNGSTLVSQATGTVTMGYDGQSVNFTNKVSTPARVVFSPQQSGAAYLKLYYRTQGSTGAFTAATVSNVGGVFAWDVDAAGVRPPSGTTNLEYYYDAYSSSNALLAPLNGDDHVHGYLSISSNQYALTGDQEIRWQINTASNSQYLVHRTQAFNAFGEIASETTGNLATTTLTYNTLGKLVKKVSPLVTVTDEHGVQTSQNPTENYSYDLSGRLVGHADADGNLTTRTLLAGSGYDGSDALALVQYNPDTTNTVTTGYDVYGDARTVKDGLNNVTSNVYDKADRLTEVDHPVRVGGNSPGVQLKDYYVYDGLGERIRHTNTVYGATAETTDYDTAGRITRTTGFGGLYTAYAYSWLTPAQASTTGLGSFGGWQTTTTTQMTASTGIQAVQTSDQFGHLISHTDLGGHTFAYTYNMAGDLTHQSGSSGQSIDFAYYTNGYIASITDNALQMKSTFQYDNDGNRTLETYNSTAANPVFYQNAAVTYDALDRVIEFKDPKADITYQYDAASNRREVKSVYSDGVSGALQTQDYWYKYDSMNRFVLTMGTLQGGVGGTIVTGSGAGAAGVAITYDAAGNRKTATYGNDGHMETYTYTADGYLENTQIGAVTVAKRTNDAMGRVTSYAQFDKTTGVVTLDHNMTYDGQNRVTAETDHTYNSSGGLLTTTATTNDYKAYVSGTGYTGADMGVIVHSHSLQTPGNATTDTYYQYAWWDEAKQSKITINATDPSNPNTGQWAPGLSSLSYDVNGHITQLVDTAGNRTVNYRNDAYGQVLVREEWDQGTLGPRQLYYYFNGHRIGDVGNNGTSPNLVDYAQQLANDAGKLTNKAGFRYGGPVASADFDENYQPINASYPAMTASTYTVQNGDTLQSIAQQLWGDASLWWLIADANGLTSASNLVTNQTLTIPNKVTNFHNTSSTFRPYDPGQAIGDTLPTLPPEPAPPPPPSHHGGCGGIGAILVAILAIVVTIILKVPLTNLFGGNSFFAGAVAASKVAPLAQFLGGVAAGAAGSAISQGVAVAAGIQDKFSWSGVALSAIGAGVSFGVDKLIPLPAVSNPIGDFLTGAARGAVSSAVTQGIGVATGLQQKFDWTGVAVSAASEGFGRLASDLLPHDTYVEFKDGLPYRFVQGGPTATNEFLSGVAGAVAGAGVASLANGTDFGDNLLAQLPNVIGPTIGNAVAKAMEPKPLQLTNNPIKLVQPEPVELEAQPVLPSDLVYNLPGADSTAGGPTGPANPANLYRYNMAPAPGGGYTTTYSPELLQNGVLTVAPGPTYRTVTITQPKNDGLASTFEVVNGKGVIHYYRTDQGPVPVPVANLTEPAPDDFHNQTYLLPDGSRVSFVPAPKPQPLLSLVDAPNPEAFLQVMRDSDPLEPLFRPVEQYIAAHPRVAAAIQGVGAVIEIGAGSLGVAGGVATSEVGAGVPVAIGGGILVVHGFDDLQAAVRSFNANKTVPTFTNQGLRAAGLSPDAANLTEMLIVAGAGVLSAGGPGLLREAGSSASEAAELGNITTSVADARVVAGAEPIVLDGAAPLARVQPLGLARTDSVLLQDAVLARPPEMIDLAGSPELSGRVQLLSYDPVEDATNIPQRGVGKFLYDASGRVLSRKGVGQMFLSGTVGGTLNVVVEHKSTDSGFDTFKHFASGFVVNSVSAFGGLVGGTGWLKVAGLAGGAFFGSTLTGARTGDSVISAVGAAAAGALGLPFEEEGASSGFALRTIKGAVNAVGANLPRFVRALAGETTLDAIDYTIETGIKGIGEFIRPSGVQYTNADGTPA